MEDETHSTVSEEEAPPAGSRVASPELVDAAGSAGQAEEQSAAASRPELEQTSVDADYDEHATESEDSEEEDEDAGMDEEDAEAVGEVAPQAGDELDAGLSEYERQRALKIQSNQAMLVALGLAAASNAITEVTGSVAAERRKAAQAAAAKRKERFAQDEDDEWEGATEAGRAASGRGIGAKRPRRACAPSQSQTTSRANEEKGGGRKAGAFGGTGRKNKKNKEDRPKPAAREWPVGGEELVGRRLKVRVLTEETGAKEWHFASVVAFRVSPPPPPPPPSY